MSRRRKRPIARPDLFRRAKWLVANGMPPTYVAAKLDISRTTELKYRRLMNHDSTVKELTRRVLALPERCREQIATAIVDARRTA